MEEDVLFANPQSAMNVLENGLNFGKEYDNALNYLMEVEPGYVERMFGEKFGRIELDAQGNAVITDAQKEAIEAEKLKRTKAYFRNVIDKNDFELARFEEAEYTFSELVGREFTYEDLFERDTLNSDDEISENIGNAINAANSLPKTNETLETFKKKIDVVDDNGNSVSDERKNEVFAVARDNAIAKAITQVSDDKTFSELNKDQQNEVIDDVASGHLTVDMIHNVQASGEILDGQADAEGRLFSDDENDKVKIPESIFLARAVAAEEKLENKAKEFKKKKFKKSSNKMLGLFKSLKEDVTIVWKNRAKVMRNAKEEFKINKYATLARPALGVGILGSTAFLSAPLAMASLCVYAIVQSQYTGFDLWAKRNRMLHNAVLSGNKAEISKYKNFWQGIKHARAAIMENPKEKVAYLRKKKMNHKVAVTSALIVGAGSFLLLGGGATLGLVGLGGVAAVTITKALGSVARVTGASKIGFASAKDAEKTFEENKTEENRLKLATARVAAWVGLGSSVAMEALVFSNVADSVAANTDALADNANAGGNGGLPEQTNAGDAQDAGNVTGNGENAADAQEAPVEDTPTIEDRYTDEMLTSDVPQEDWNISKSEWRFIQKVLPGYLGTEEGAEHMNVAQEEMVAAIREKLSNIEAYAADNPGIWGDMTPMQVLTKGLRRMAYSTQVVSDGDTHLVNPDEFVIWGDTKEEMTAMKSWYEIVICGKVPTETPDAEAMQWGLGRVTRSGNLLDTDGNVIDMSNGNNNNRMVGIVCGKAVFENVPLHEKVITVSVPEVPEQVVPEQVVVEHPAPVKDDATADSQSNVDKVIVNATDEDNANPHTPGQNREIHVDTSAAQQEFHNPNVENSNAVRIFINKGNGR